MALFKFVRRFRALHPTAGYGPQEFAFTKKTGKETNRDESVRRTQVQLSFTEITPITRHTCHKRNEMLAFSKTDIAFRTPETTLHILRNIM